MSSNYPPGVTGFEYAIGGAEREWQEIQECPACETIGYMDHEFHHEFGIRAFCTNKLCPLSKEGFEVEPDEPEYDKEDDAHER